MDSKDIFKKHQSVVGLLKLEDGKIILDTDDSKIDVHSVVVCLNQFIAQYLQLEE